MSSSTRASRRSIGARSAGNKSRVRRPRACPRRASSRFSSASPVGNAGATACRRSLAHGVDPSCDAALAEYRCRLRPCPADRSRPGRLAAAARLRAAVALVVRQSPRMLPGKHETRSDANSGSLGSTADRRARSTAAPAARPVRVRTNCRRWTRISAIAGLARSVAPRRSRPRERGDRSLVKPAAQSG